MTARLDLTLPTLFNNLRFLQRDLRLRPAAAGCPVHGDGCLESVEGLGEAGRGALAIHEAVDKADGVVFRCTLSGSAADRLLEVPAWMFDRARCLDPSRLTASPFVSMDALSVLSDLLRQALKPPLSSSNAPHSGASRSSHDQNRGEADDHAKPGTTASDAGRTAKASAKRPFPADRPVRRRNADADSGMAGPAGGDAGYVDRPDGAPDPGARSDQQPGLTDGGRS